MYRKILYNEEFKKFCKFFFELNKASLIVPPVLFFLKQKIGVPPGFYPLTRSGIKSLTKLMAKV